MITSININTTKNIPVKIRNATPLNGHVMSRQIFRALSAAFVT